MLWYLLPFLIVFFLIMAGGSAYYLIADRIRNRLPDPIECTPIIWIDFDRRF